MQKIAIKDGLSNFLTIIIVVSTLGIIGNLIAYNLCQQMPGLDEQLGISYKMMKIDSLIFLMQIFSSVLILKYKKIGIYLFIFSSFSYVAKTIFKDPTFFIVPIALISIAYLFFFILVKSSYKYMT